MEWNERWIWNSFYSVATQFVEMMGRRGILEPSFEIFLFVLFCGKEMFIFVCKIGK